MKISKFIQDAAVYIEMAHAKLKKEDYLGALQMYRHALNFVDKKDLEKQIDIKLEICETLHDLELYEASNREYLKLFVHKIYLDAIIFGIIKNYISMNNYEAAKEFYELAEELEIIETNQDLSSYGIDEQGFESEGLCDDCAANRDFDLLKPNDNSKEVSVARSLVSNQQMDLARDILKKIPVTSEQYHEALNYLALIEISESFPQKGLKIARKVLEESPSDMYALTTEVIALDMLGIIDERDEKIKKLDELDISEWPEVTKVALCFAQIENCELAIKYLERSLESMPFDRELLLLYAMCNANVYKFSKAKDAIHKILSCFPDDAVALYYASDFADKVDVVDAKKKKSTSKKLAYSIIPDVPKMIRIEFGNLMQDACTSKTPREFCELIEKDFKFYMAVLYGLFNESEQHAINLGEIIAKGTASSKSVLANKLLVDPYFPLVAKKYTLLAMIKSTRKQPIEVEMLVEDTLLLLCPEIPKTLVNKKLFDAYWEVYVTLACMDELIFLEDDLFEVAKKLGKKISVDQKFSQRTLAAYLLTKTSKEFSKEYACELFRASKQSYDKVDAAIKAYKTPYKTPSKK